VLCERETGRDRDCARFLGEKPEAEIFVLHEEILAANFEPLEKMRVVTITAKPQGASKSPSKRNGSSSSVNRKSHRRPREGGFAAVRRATRGECFILFQDSRWISKSLWGHAGNFAVQSEPACFHEPILFHAAGVQPVTNINSQWHSVSRIKRRQIVTLVPSPG
jgi:hypothetical protein